MIQNDVGGRAEIHRALARLRVQAALPEPHIRDDNVVLAAARDFTSHDPNAGAWSRRTVDGQVAGEGHGRAQFDVSGDIKDDDAVRRTDAVTKRARAGVVEVGDMAGRTACSTGGDCAETYCPGESKGRCQRGKSQCERSGNQRAEHYSCERPLRLKPSSSDLLEAKKKELGDLKGFYVS